MLKPAGTSGMFRRVGVAELPYRYDRANFEEDAWEMRDITII
jgi:hypothetical protein